MRRKIDSHNDPDPLSSFSTVFLRMFWIPNRIAIGLTTSIVKSGEDPFKQLVCTIRSTECRRQSGESVWDY